MGEQTDQWTRCAECGGAILHLPAPITRELTWYHSDAPNHADHDATPTKGKTMSNDEQFPMDWNQWRAAWLAWREDHRADLQPSTYRFPGKNFLADEILGVWSIDGRAVELSEVTFLGTRGIGITYGAAGTVHLAGPVVHSFAELEAELGIQPREAGR